MVRSNSTSFFFFKIKGRYFHQTKLGQEVWFQSTRIKCCWGGPYRLRFASTWVNGYTFLSPLALSPFTLSPHPGTPGPKPLSVLELLKLRISITKSSLILCVCPSPHPMPFSLLLPAAPALASSNFPPQLASPDPPGCFRPLRFFPGQYSVPLNTSLSLHPRQPAA